MLTRAEAGLWHWSLSRGECPWGLNPVSRCYMGDLGATGNVAEVGQGTVMLDLILGFVEGGGSETISDHESNKIHWER